MKYLENIRKTIRAVWRIYDDRKQLRFDQRKHLLEQNLLGDVISGITDERYCNHEVIVSLTTYDKRLYDVHLAIESVMQQTMKANRIILWLADELKDRPLPRALMMQCERGLEIRFCKDLRSYKKLVPALQEFPENAIITIDDDILYEIDMLERLISAYQQDSHYIYCCRQHYMRLDKNRHLLPYRQWKWEYPVIGEADVMNFPTGCAGTLYPPHSLDEEVFNETVFMDICPYADDVWFKAMAMKKGTLSQKVCTHFASGNDFLENDSVQETRLSKLNTEGECLNDKQIDAVFRKYDLYKLLR